jgi:putative NADH-flavin reductase
MVVNIVVFGATGMVGSRIATEAGSRGHKVVAVSRSGDSPADDPNVTAVKADGSDPSEVARACQGADVVASALGPRRDIAEPTGPFLALNQALLAGMHTAGVQRLVIVGGAGSLLVRPDTQLMDTPDFPAAYRAEAKAHAALLTRLRTTDGLDWPDVSPAPLIEPGERTASYRLGGDELITDESGRISAEDFAVAFVDEIESHAHPRARISIAS